MESQPQNPEFRNNPESFHPCFIRLCLGSMGMEGVVSELCYKSTILQRNYRNFNAKIGIHRNGLC